MLFLRLALSPFFLGQFGLAGLQLACHVYDDTAIVAAARRARPVGYTRSPALTGHERLGLQGMVAAAVSRVRMRMSHSDDHGGTIAKYGLKDKPRPWIRAGFKNILQG